MAEQGRTGGVPRGPAREGGNAKLVELFLVGLVTIFMYCLSVYSARQLGKKALLLSTG